MVRFDADIGLSTTEKLMSYMEGSKMLVLTRKKNETIVIDDQIVVKILQVKGNRIRLGISAPTDVAVRRGELDPALQSTVEIVSDQPRMSCPLH